MRAERIGNRSGLALEYLAREPQVNVFLTYLLLFDISPLSRTSMYIALDDRDAVRGVAYFGRQIVLAGDDDAVAAFAELGRKYHGEKMIVGPRPAIQRYWSRVSAWHQEPRAIRERQLLMSLDRPGLVPSYERTVSVRHARIDEWTAVADNSAAMIAHELDYDPRGSSPEFTANVRAMIERQLWWVGESFGRLCFYLNIGPWSPQTAQLQGIWTPPELRGKGLATSALGAICNRLLDVSPTLSLYVNDFNTPAIALYERVGFKTIGEFQTLLF